MVGLLDILWDDVLAGPQPDKGLGQLRHPHAHDLHGDAEKERMMNRRRSGEYQRNEEETRRVTQSISIKRPPAIETVFDSSYTPASSPVASSPLASPATREKENIWRNVFHPAQNRALNGMCAAKFDNASPKSPSVYDWVVISALDK